MDLTLNITPEPDPKNFEREELPFPKPGPEATLEIPPQGASPVELPAPPEESPGLMQSLIQDHMSGFARGLDAYLRESLYAETTREFTPFKMAVVEHWARIRDLAPRLDRPAAAKVFSDVANRLAVVLGAIPMTPRWQNLERKNQVALWAAQAYTEAARAAITDSSGVSTLEGAARTCQGTASHIQESLRTQRTVAERLDQRAQSGNPEDHAQAAKAWLTYAAREYDDSLRDDALQRAEGHRRLAGNAYRETVPIVVDRKRYAEGTDDPAAGPPSRFIRSEEKLRNGKMRRTRLMNDWFIDQEDGDPTFTLWEPGGSIRGGAEPRGSSLYRDTLIREAQAAKPLEPPREVGARVTREAQAAVDVSVEAAFRALAESGAFGRARHLAAVDDYLIHPTIPKWENLKTMVLGMPLHDRPPTTIWNRWLATCPDAPRVGSRFNDDDKVIEEWARIPTPAEILTALYWSGPEQET